MRPAFRALAVLSTVLVLGACGGGGATTAPTVAAPSATAAAAVTEAPKVCTDPGAGAATVVAASVGGNEWGAVTAKVDDVITWTNSDGVPHRVELDDGSCKMAGNIAGGGTKSLVFTQAGTFPFHCGVHAGMKGTITIN
jgi:plastocyanin